MSYNLFLSSSSAVRAATLITAIRPDQIFWHSFMGFKKNMLWYVLSFIGKQYI